MCLPGIKTDDKIAEHFYNKTHLSFKVQVLWYCLFIDQLRIICGVPGNIASSNNVGKQYSNNKNHPSIETNFCGSLFIDNSNKCRGFAYLATKQSVTLYNKFVFLHIYGIFVRNKNRL